MISTLSSKTNRSYVNPAQISRSQVFLLTNLSGLRHYVLRRLGGQRLEHRRNLLIQSINLPSLCPEQPFRLRRRILGGQFVEGLPIKWCCCSRRRIFRPRSQHSGTCSFKPSRHHSGRSGYINTLGFAAILLLAPGSFSSDHSSCACADQFCHSSQSPATKDYHCQRASDLSISQRR